MGKATQCLRVLNFRDGVHIGDAEVVFLGLLPRGPWSKRAQVVAQMQGPGGLNARKDTRSPIGRFDSHSEISSFFAQDTPPINASFGVERNAPPLSHVKRLSHVKHLWHIMPMAVHLSIKAKLVMTATAGQELKSTMEEFNRACNTLSELAFQRDLHRKYDIHHEGYRLIRQETNLPAQHVI